MEYRIQTLNQLKPLVQGFRRKSGLTQAAMAERLGVSQQAYAQIESNLSSTSVERLYTILRLLNIDINFVSLAGSQAVVENNTSVSPKLMIVDGIKSKKKQGNKEDQESRKMVGKDKKPSTSIRKLNTAGNKKVTLFSPVKLSKRSDTTKW
jgi:HTH-type transcriptional regulator/antitoxin HipB